MKRGAGWPIAVMAILATTVGVDVCMAVIAGDDPSFSVEQDYYKKAIGWDSTMAQARENQRLGWRLQPRLGAMSSNNGARLDVVLVDSVGAPIRDATVRVSAFYNARASAIVHATLDRRPAAYSVQLPVTQTGEWEFRFDVSRGAQRFTSISRIEAVAAGRTT